MVPLEGPVALQPAEQHVGPVELAAEVDQQRGDALELGSGLLNLGQQLVQPGLGRLELGHPAERSRPAARRHGGGELRRVGPE